MPRATLVFLALTTLPAIVFAGTCFTCDTKCGCVQPLVEECPARTHCYTLKSNSGDIVQKGCAVSCLRVNAHDHICDTCDGELCNSEQSLIAMNGIDECSNTNIKDQLMREINNPNQVRRDIGQGAQSPYAPGPIGSGAQPNYGGSIGSGAQPNYGGSIGSGGQPNYGGSIGTGAQPNYGQGSGYGQGIQPGYGSHSGQAPGYNGGQPIGQGAQSGYNPNNGYSGGIIGQSPPRMDPAYSSPYSNGPPPIGRGARPNGASDFRSAGNVFIATLVVTVASFAFGH